VRSCFRFDDVVLDLAAFRLTRAGRPIHLEPKVLELLGYLVQHRGRLVEKPELQAAVWSDAAVSESALTRAVAQLRRFLGDDAREARYVETVPTRGYRFRSEVRVEEGRNGHGSPDLAHGGDVPSSGASPRQRHSDRAALHGRRHAARDHARARPALGPRLVARRQARALRRAPRRAVVYWMDVETGEERRITDHGRVRDAIRTPAWSRSGDTVAYERLEASGSVWVLDLGKAPRPSLRTY
jgi:DNA-binding winged helix-turn-helix (wHTH) protein